MIDIIIIGCGPAGISAAIQLKRYNYDFMILEKDQIGGLIRNANLIENYPGFPDGIRGTELVRLFSRHLEKNDIKPVYEKVEDLDYLDDLFYIKTRKSYHRSRYIIIATGTEPNLLSLPNLKELNDKFIFYDIYRLFDTKGKNIAIIGAGDAAFDYALNLSGNNSITIFNRKEDYKCLPLLYERAVKSPDIIYLNKTSINNIFPAQSNNIKVEYFSNGSNEIKQSFFDLIIPAIGRKPSDGFLSKRLLKNMSKLQANNRLFMAGDLINDDNRQIGISIGNGILSAMEIKRHKEGK